MPATTTRTSSPTANQFWSVTCFVKRRRIIRGSPYSELIADHSNKRQNRGLSTLYREENAQVAAGPDHSGVQIEAPYFAWSLSSRTKPPWAQLAVDWDQSLLKLNGLSEYRQAMLNLCSRSSDSLCTLLMGPPSRFTASRTQPEWLLSNCRTVVPGFGHPLL